MKRSHWKLLSRSIVNVLLALRPLPKGATYEGLRQALSMSTVSGARQAVRKARRENLVAVVQTGVGPGAEGLVVLTPKGERYCREVFGRVG